MEEAHAEEGVGASCQGMGGGCILEPSEQVQSSNLTPVAVKFKKLMPAIHSVMVVVL